MLSIPGSSIIAVVVSNGVMVVASAHARKICASRVGARRGRAGVAPIRCASAEGRPRGRVGDRPMRWILPMTALRVTPISPAIWLQVSPAVT
jgi:hypothetical protein